MSSSNNNDDDHPAPAPSSSVSTLPQHSSKAQQQQQQHSSAPRPPPNETREQWQSRVRSVQMATMTDEKKSELLQRANRSADMRKKAKEWTGHSHRSVHAKNSSYVAMSSASVAPQAPAVSRGYQQQQLQAFAAGGASRPQQAQMMMDQLDADDEAIQASFAPVAPQPREQQRFEAQEEEAAMHTGNIAGFGALVSASSATERVNESEEAAALRQLQHEPKDEAEVEAKFAIFSKFSDKVMKLRSDFDVLMRSSVETEMPAAVAEGIKRNVRAQLECDAARGIHDQSRFWFVHDMFLQSTKNVNALANLSDDVARKIRLLANEDDACCPVCLCDYDEAEVKKMILSCTHSTCATCWSRIQEIKGSAAACVLCREEVLSDIIAE